MPELKRVAKQCLAGVPYLKKELARRVSLSTGKVLTTPMTYYVIFSGRCNLACTYCYIYRETEPSLSGEDMFRIVRQAKDLSGKGFNISLSGGEPMIFKPLYDTLALAHKLGVNFGFTTNGLALTKSNVEKALAYDPFNVNISLDSTDPKVNESLRPFPDGTRKTLEGIDNLLAEKERTGSRVSIIVKPTIMEQNFRTLPDLVRHFGKGSKVQVNFQPYVGHVGSPFWVKDFQGLRQVIDEIQALQHEGYSVIGNPSTFNGFYDYLSHPPSQTDLRTLDLEGHKRNCDIGLRTMFVYANGDVFFCDFLKKPIGNIHSNSLSDIYYGAAADSQRRIMVNCAIDCQQACKRPVPLWVKARSWLRMG
jgi:MoaA/NifB/PqqE/SkfB family radical SAM enzyme